MLPFSGTHITPLIAAGNLVKTNWKYMETDIAFEFIFFGTATTQLGGNNGIDQAPDFRFTCRCFVGNAQPILVENTIVFVKFARVIFKFSSSWSL